MWTAEDGAGYGYPGEEDRLAIKARPGATAAGPGFHLAFAAESRRQVDEFFRAALDHGGSDQGKPGLRPHYGPSYYAAFVADPDGHGLEAVCHSVA